jgi:hypothetical protein
MDVLYSGAMEKKLKDQYVSPEHMPQPDDHITGILRDYWMEGPDGERIWAWPDKDGKLHPVGEWPPKPLDPKYLEILEIYEELFPPKKLRKG